MKSLKTTCRTISFLILSFPLISAQDFPKGLAALPSRDNVDKKANIHAMDNIYKLNECQTVHLVKGDILEQPVDAIVNPANPSLRHLGGLCGVIHKAAGPRLEEECLSYKPLAGTDVRCDHGDAVITKGYNIKSPYVIHTVGPIWKPNDAQQAQILANAYKKSLQLAQQSQLTSIAFPAISCGIFGYPLIEAATIAVDTVCNLAIIGSLTKIYIVVFSQEHFDSYKQILDAKFSN